MLQGFQLLAQIYAQGYLVFKNISTQLSFLLKNLGTK